MLREPDATVERVARRVGYGSAFALSAAFKRVRGMSPQAFRAGSSGPDAELAPGPGGTVVLSPPEVRSRRG